MAYTTINNPSAHFHTQLYTGDGQASKTITNDANAGDFKPDWIWIKNRDDSDSNMLSDSNRGSTKALVSNTDGAEFTPTNGNLAFLTDGFSFGSNNNYNRSSDKFVAWQWKANGGTTASNSSGSTTVTTQVNSTAGFSIITGNGSDQAGQTFGHGLSAAPDFFTFRMSEDTAHWICYHRKMGPGYYLRLDQNVAKVSNGNIFSNTDPSSTLIYYGGNSMFTSGAPFICYAFTSIKGYSKFGSYTGNGNADGPFIYTGFKPAYFCVKALGLTQNWQLWDNKRNDYSGNPRQEILSPSSTSTESGDYNVDFLSNGVKIRDTDGAWNGNGNDYIYLAFAQNPLVGTNNVISLAN